MYYVPAQYPNAYNFYFRNSGITLDPQMLMEKHSYIENKGKNFLDRLPPELQQRVEHRKSKLIILIILGQDFLIVRFGLRNLKQNIVRLLKRLVLQDVSDYGCGMW